MILRKLFREGLIYTQHNKNVLNLALVSHNKMQDNSSLLHKVNFTFSRNKQQLKKKNIPAN